MQYILSEEEYQEFCQLRSEAARRESDAAWKAQIAAEKSKMNWPQGPLPNSFFKPHAFQENEGEDCEICKTPDCNPVHAVNPVDISTEPL